MTKLLIVDDEVNAQEAIAHLVRQNHSELDILPPTDSVKSSVKSIQENKPDIVLLDIEIKGGSGFDVLNHFENPPFKTIFITAFQKYAVQAFKFSALDYILKPVDPQQLTETLERVSERIVQEKISQKVETFLHNLSNNSYSAKKIVLKTLTSIHIINLSEIIYCQADGSYTIFFLSDKSKIMVSNTLGHYEEFLEE